MLRVRSMKNHVQHDEQNDGDAKEPAQNILAHFLLLIGGCAVERDALAQQSRCPAADGVLPRLGISIAISSPTLQVCSVFVRAINAESSCLPPSRIKASAFPSISRPASRPLLGGQAIARGGSRARSLHCQGHRGGARRGAAGRERAGARNLISLHLAAGLKGAWSGALEPRGCR